MGPPRRSRSAGCCPAPAQSPYSPTTRSPLEPACRGRTPADRAGLAAAETARWRELAGRLVDGYDPASGQYEQLAKLFRPGAAADLSPGRALRGVIRALHQPGTVAGVLAGDEMSRPLRQPVALRSVKPVVLVPAGHSSYRADPAPQVTPRPSAHNRQVTPGDQEPSLPAYRPSVPSYPQPRPRT